MKVGTITQHGLVLSSDLAILPAQHSANFEIGVLVDPVYSDYTAVLNISYPTEGFEYQTVSVAVDNKIIKMPETAFGVNGTVFLSLGLTKGNETIITHPIALTVTEAPGSSVALPPEDIWQTQVRAYVEAYLAKDFFLIKLTPKEYAELNPKNPKATYVVIDPELVK